MSETIEKVIVVKISDSTTGDNDALVTFFSYRGPFVLLAKGVNKTISKNRANLQIGSLVEIEYFRARKKGSIGKLKKANMLENIDYSKYLNLIFLSKTMNLFNQVKGFAPNLFNAYILCLNRLGEGFNKALYLFCLANALKYFGLSSVINQCVECKNTDDLSDFSFYKGGFLCSQHSENKRWIQELKIIYFMFTNFDNYIQNVNSKIINKLYIEIMDFYQSNGIYL